MGCAASNTETAAFVDARSMPGLEGEQVRSVRRFKGIHATDGIEAHVTTSSDGSFSVVLEGAPEDVAKVRSRVDPFGGTLVLSRASSAGDSRVVARVIAPGPLTHAGASARGVIVIDTVVGCVAAATKGQVVVDRLESFKPVSVAAAKGGSVTIAGGQAPFASISCARESEIQLGDLRADRAVVVVAWRSRVEGMTVGSANATLSKGSSLSIAATGHVGLCSSDSEVQISGEAEVSMHKFRDSKIDRLEAHGDAGPNPVKEFLCPL